MVVQKEDDAKDWIRKKRRAIKHWMQTGGAYDDDDDDDDDDDAGMITTTARTVQTQPQEVLSYTERKQQTIDLWMETGGAYDNDDDDDSEAFISPHTERIGSDHGHEDILENRWLNGIYPEKHVFDQTYLLFEELGRGSFGIVRKCRRRVPDSAAEAEDRALKTILKAKIEDPHTLRDEINILLTLEHPNIIKLYEVYEDDEQVYLVTELCTGGELYDRVVQKMRNNKKTFTEVDAARILRSIIDGIAYCHTKGIVHRDLKPENFLFQTPADTATIKIIDFGLAGRFEKKSAEHEDHHHLHEEVGTIYYVAPEVLTGKYSEKCDLWSIGVTAYVLLCGFAPFNAGSEADTYRLVEKGLVQYPSPAWDKISTEARQFVQALLQSNVEQRLSAQQALAHPWLNHESIFQKGMKQLTNKFLNLTTTTTTTTSSDTDNADTNTSGSSSAAPTPQRRPRKKITSMNETGIVYNDLERSQQFHQCYQDNRNKKQIEHL